MGGRRETPRRDRSRYRLIVVPHALKELEALARLPVYPRVRAAIDGLPGNPRPAGSRKMTGVDTWRLRVGDYRIIYEIADVIRVVTVTRVRHRGIVYER